MNVHRLPLVALLGLALAACGQAAPAAPNAAPAPAAAPAAAQPASAADLSGIKDYLLGQTKALTAAAALKAASDRYYALAEGAGRRPPRSRAPATSWTRPSPRPKRPSPATTRRPPPCS